MSILYDRIKGECDLLGITGYRLCKDCGISPSVMTDLLKGRKQKLSADYLLKISKRLDVSPEYLQGTSENKKDPDTMTDAEARDELYKYLVMLKNRPDLLKLVDTAKDLDPNVVAGLTNTIIAVKETK